MHRKAAQPVLSARVEARFIDRMGHMNIEWYTHFFQQTIWVFYEQIGFGADYHKGSGFGSFLLESHYVYLNELRGGQDFSIFMRLLGRRDKVFHMLLYMRRDADKQLAATLENTGLHMNLKTRKSVPMSAELAQRWDQELERHEQLQWPYAVKSRLSIAKPGKRATSKEVST